MNFHLHTCSIDRAFILKYKGLARGWSLVFVLSHVSVGVR